MAVVEPMPPPPVAMDPIPVAVTNTPPVEVVPEPEPPPSAPAMVAVHEEPAAPSVEVAAPAPPVADPATAIDSGPAWDAIRTAIHRHLAYPDSARRRGEEGRVLLALTVGADGALVEAEALAEGASSRLMTAALTAVRRAAPFAPSARGEFNIPVVFRLTPARGTGI